MLREVEISCTLAKSKTVMQPSARWPWSFLSKHLETMWTYQSLVRIFIVVCRWWETSHHPLFWDWWETVCRQSHLSSWENVRPPGWIPFPKFLEWPLTLGSTNLWVHRFFTAGCPRWWFVQTAQSKWKDKRGALVFWVTFMCNSYYLKLLHGWETPAGCGAPCCLSLVYLNWMTICSYFLKKKKLKSEHGSRLPVVLCWWLSSETDYNICHQLLFLIPILMFASTKSTFLIKTCNRFSFDELCSNYSPLNGDGLRASLMPATISSNCLTCWLNGPNSIISRSKQQ